MVFMLSIILVVILIDWHSDDGCRRMMMLKDYYSHLDDKKMCYPNLTKMNTIHLTKEARVVCNDKLKQVVRICTKQRLKVSNGTND